MKTYAILAALLVGVVLASGCTQQPQGSGGNGQQNQQPSGVIQPSDSQPVSPLQVGSWARVALTTTSAKPIEFTYKFLEKTLNGAAYEGIETETGTGVSLVLWEKGKAGSPGVKMYSLAKFGQLALCNAINAASESLPATANPYQGNAEGVSSLGAGTYTTSSGKTVSVVKYRSNTSGVSGEYWYSSQVPFPLAWSETNTTVAGREVTSVMELQDFGTGASTAFADKDFERCQ
jgi:hypothetical protein